MSAVISDSTRRVLWPRQLVASFWGCAPSTVRRHIVPVACEVKSRQVLYDAEDLLKFQVRNYSRVSRLRQVPHLTILGGTDDACPKPAHRARAAGFRVSGGTMPDLSDEPATMRVRPVIDESAVAEFAAVFADRVAERVAAAVEDRMRRMGLTVDIS